jgi:hypothetical protein
MTPSGRLSSGASILPWQLAQDWPFGPGLLHIGTAALSVSSSAGFAVGSS